MAFVALQVSDYSSRTVLIGVARIQTFQTGWKIASNVKTFLSYKIKPSITVIDIYSPISHNHVSSLHIYIRKLIFSCMDNLSSLATFLRELNTDGRKQEFHLWMQIFIRSTVQN
ncbi:hypothetical protein OS493_008092 [Desmophyllum pertusum]|uniref:Uncharacterized protein n=1 Tax=Desmophyllum pertusum TaxID=174260 RepID=A0A9W9YI83_9CNID|nr:hypothetical protein OS493_008092 [Desmophyllum pertusum]